MIIDDSVDDSTSAGSSSKLLPSAHRTLRLPEPAARSSVSLPSYELSEAQQRSELVFSKPTKPSLPQRFDSRFWRGTFFALAIYVLLSVIIGIPVIVTRIAARKRAPSPPNIQSLFLQDSNAAAPLMQGGQVMATSDDISCDIWDSMGSAAGLFTASVRHTLSPDGLFSVRSNATDEVVPRSGGRHNLTVAMNDDASETDVVLTMTLAASSSDLRDAAHFCFATTGDMRGYSIYMPRNIPPTDYLAFDVQIMFPQSASSLTATDFITYLPMFSQIFSPISSMRISSYNLAGAGVDIVCENLQADKILVKNSFASISGQFNVTQSLTLDNIGGPLQSNVTLVNDPSTGLATYLVLGTGNGDINTDVTLVSTSSATPRFNGNVQTFNGSLDLNVGHDARTSPALICLTSSNNQGPTKIFLDSKFTGLYDVKTKLGHVKVAHPHDMASNWHMFVDSNSSSATRGWAGWGTRPTGTPDPMTQSKVTASSSLSPILLHFGT